MANLSSQQCLEHTTSTPIANALFSNMRFCCQAFRSHDNFNLTQKNAKAVFIMGPNGAGKTNLLEALSLLAPGRGLRTSKTQDFTQIHQKKSWGIAFCLDTPDGPLDLRVTPYHQSRQYIVNGAPLKRQADLTDFLSVLWLTPRMDMLFRESLTIRRRFFDRLFTSLDTIYAPLLLHFENLLKMWRQLIETRTPETQWPPYLELSLAQKAAYLTQKRAYWLQKLLLAIEKYELCDKPVNILLEGVAEKACANKTPGEKTHDALVALFMKLWTDTRKAYRERLRLQDGPSHTKIHITYNTLPIELASTGEQKMTLISLVLAAAYTRAEEAPNKPFLLLLDEIAAHLDQKRTAYLAAKLKQPNIIPWITGTEPLIGLKHLEHEVVILPSEKSA